MKSPSTIACATPAFRRRAETSHPTTDFPTPDRPPISNASARFTVPTLAATDERRESTAGFDLVPEPPDDGSLPLSMHLSDVDDGEPAGGGTGPFAAMQQRRRGSGVADPPAGGLVGVGGRR